jgi:hypothetical protein
MSRIAVTALLALAACAPTGADDVGPAPTISAAEVAPSGVAELSRTELNRGNGKPTSGGGSGGNSPSNGIDYHGGAVMLGTADVYYIWYGTWTNASERAVLTNLADKLGGSPYYNINTTYADAQGNKVSNATVFAGETFDTAYSRGKTLADSDIQLIVAAAINSAALPDDPNGVYFVVGSADVKESSGFCSKYCGWHTHATIAGTDIKYAFVGNPDQCPTSCAAQTVSPTGHPGVDAMASIVAHELEEAVSDPDLNAWFDKRGQENADKCAWTFGTKYKTANGASANMNLGGTDYLIQQNWVNANGGSCALAY